jgi:hypothetical protein
VAFVGATAALVAVGAPPEEGVPQLLVPVVHAAAVASASAPPSQVELREAEPQDR